MIQRPATLLSLALAAVVTAGCGGQGMNVKLWPFGGGGSGPADRPREPANVVQYQCAAGKGFILRRLDGGAAAWLVLPEREVRLERLEADGSRYGKGGLALELGADSVRLSDGGTVAYDDCKPAMVAK